MKDAANIGSTKGVQNPEELWKKQQGTYQDNTSSMSEKDKVDFMPKGPDPSPFTVKR